MGVPPAEAGMSEATALEADKVLKPTVDAALMAATAERDGLAVPRDKAVAMPAAKKGPTSKSVGIKPWSFWDS